MENQEKSHPDDKLTLAKTEQRQQINDDGLREERNNMKKERAENLRLRAELDKPQE